MFHSPRAFAPRIGFCFLALAMTLSACQKRRPAEHPNHRDKLVPEKMQRRSERNFNQQQQMGDELGMTPSERAGAQHQRTIDERHQRAEDESRQ